MKTITASAISATVSRLCQSANYHIGGDILRSLKKSIRQERSPTGKEILKQIVKNHAIAGRENLPICQDCGYTVIFLDIGTEVRVRGDIYKAVNRGVREGYRRGYLRKSIISDPLRGFNTGDNTPAVIHSRLVPGRTIRITVAPKGAGSENSSGIRMLKPNDGSAGIKDFVVEQVLKAGANACPPLVVGIGIGGTFEYAPLLAKKALLRRIGERHPDPFYARLERTILRAINRTGIGPMGLGGTVTALDVFIETYPRHLASLPVAVNLNCHATRYKTARL